MRVLAAVNQSDYSRLALEYLGRLLATHRLTYRC